MAIDGLVKWALRDELPKGQPVSRTPWDMIEEYGRIGRPRERQYGGGDFLGMVPGTPHPDAEAIGRALSGLPDAAQLLAEDCFALLGPYGALDVAGVHHAAERQRYNLQAMMVRSAILSPPEWNIGLPSPQPLRRRANGQARVHVDRDGEMVETPAHPKHGGWQHVIALGPRCLLEWSEPDVPALLTARAEYALWHRGLVMVREAVAGKLAEHEALTPEAAERPWLMPPGKPRRVLRSRGATRLSRLPLKPDRPRALPPLRFEPGESKQSLQAK